MAIGWLYLYSRHRKARRRLRELELEREEANVICDNCGYPRHQHANDSSETCPIYIDNETR